MSDVDAHVPRLVALFQESTVSRFDCPLTAQANQLKDFRGLVPVRNLTALDASRNKIEALDGLEQVRVYTSVLHTVRSLAAFCAPPSLRSAHIRPRVTQAEAVVCATVHTLMVALDP